MRLLNAVLRRCRPRALVLAACLPAACAPAQVLDTPAPAPVAGDHIRFAMRPDTAAFTEARAVSLDADHLVFERFVASPVGRPGAWVATQVPTDSLARLQVRVGQHRNTGRGALIGSVVGVGLGALCAAGASSSDGWYAPSGGECLASGVFTGALTGLLIGALHKSDVWAPAELPARPQPAPITASR